MTDSAAIKVGVEMIEVELENLKPIGTGSDTSKPATFRCPHCGNTGVFSSGAGGRYTSSVANSSGTNFQIPYWMGVRTCPNLTCQSPVFMIEQDGRTALTYPPRTIDFNPAKLPPLVKASLEEAIRAHAAHCHKAAALMVRRTLEEVCRDRGAEGNNLKKRLEDLKSKITLPQALFDAMDNLRLLGNDAAHVEAQTYDNVGEAETEIAIDLSKEIVKAAYQYEDLLEKLRGLQTSNGGA